MDDAVCSDGSNGVKAFFDKGIHECYRCIPTVTQKIGINMRKRKRLCNILYHLYLGFRFLVQDHGVIQDDPVTGKHHGHRLMPMVLPAPLVGLVEIRIFDRMQSPGRRLCPGRNRIIHNAEHGLYGTQRLPVNDLDYRFFQGISQLSVLPRSFIQEMGDYGPVIGTVCFKALGFCGVQSLLDFPPAALSAISGTIRPSDCRVYFALLR